MVCTEGDEGGYALRGRGSRERTEGGDWSTDCGVVGNGLRRSGGWYELRGGNERMD